MKERTAQNSLAKIKINIGKITYLNCLPFYHGLQDTETAELNYLSTYPAKLNRALRKGEIDCGPVSSLEYLNHQDQYCLLPSLAVGSRNFSGSVILFSHKKIEDLNGTKIAVSQESLSSAALLKIILKFKYKFENTYFTCRQEPDKLIERPEAFLMIGDQALFYRPDHFIYRYDLSELWWDWTQKPFCFAVWAVRKEFLSRHKDEVESLWNSLKYRLDINLSSLEDLIQSALQIDFLNERYPKMFGYLFNLAYQLDEPMAEGLELFYRLANRLHLSPKARPLDFAFGDEIINLKRKKTVNC